MVDVSDLVVLKVLAARAKDLEDVATILRVQRDRIDDVRVRHVLTMLERRSARAISRRTRAPPRSAAVTDRWTKRPWRGVIGRRAVPWPSRISSASLES